MGDWIDIHSHIIPGVDDGCTDMDMAIRMLRIAQDNGIGTIILTPHYKPHRTHPPVEKLRHLVDKLSESGKSAGIDITLLLGNEIMFSSNSCERLNSGQALSLNNTDYVLTEFNPMDDYRYIRDGLYELLTEGYIPIVAHVERYKALMDKRDRVGELTDMGCYIQVNAGSIMGDYGLMTRHFARKLLKEDLVHFVATDAHDDRKRTPAIARCAQYIERSLGEDACKRLLHDNQMRVIRGEEIEY